MRSQLLVACCAAAAALACWSSAAESAPPANAATSELDSVVATAGDARLTLREVEKRVAQVPLFQLRTLGQTPDDIRRAFVDELVGMELVVQGARADGLAKRPDVAERIRSVLKSALLSDLRDEAVKRGQVSDAEVRAYYEQNRERYQPQLRLKLWQIVVATRQDAERVLALIKDDAEYKKDPIAGWDKLCRERSLDKTTSMRKGDLGFVHPDGSTAQKDVTVSPVLFTAASKVANGEVVPEPVAVAGQWVVLQRRGSHQTPERSLEAESANIRNVLAKEKVQATLRQLLDELRRTRVNELHEDRVDLVAIDTDGSMRASPRPGSLRRPAAASPRPTGEPGALR
jgi:peptidyl-prolyl cis-trans isomerase C